MSLKSKNLENDLYIEHENNKNKNKSKNQNNKNEE